MKLQTSLAILLLISTLLSLLAGCKQANLQTPKPENPVAPTLTSGPALNPSPEADWQASTPEEQGMDANTLSAMLEHVQAKKMRLHSLLILRNGSLVTEAYWGTGVRGSARTALPSSRLTWAAGQNWRSD